MFNACHRLATLFACGMYLLVACSNKSATDVDIAMGGAGEGGAGGQGGEDSEPSAGGDAQGGGGVEQSNVAEMMFNGVIDDFTQVTNGSRSEENLLDPALIRLRPHLEN